MPKDTEEDSLVEEYTGSTDRDINMFVAALLPLYVLWTAAITVSLFFLGDISLLIGLGGAVYIIFGTPAVYALGVEPSKYVFVSSYCKAYWRMMLVWPLAGAWRLSKEAAKFYRS